MKRFKLLAGGHEQNDPGTNELHRYKAGEIVVSPTDLAARFGREKFLYIGEDDGSTPLMGGSLDADSEIAQLEARLAHLKNGRQDLTPSQSVNEKGLPGSVEPSRSEALEAGYGKFDTLTVAELKELVEAEEIDLEGAHTKAEIIARLRSL